MDLARNRSDEEAIKVSDFPALIQKTLFRKIDISRSQCRNMQLGESWTEIVWLSIETTYKRENCNGYYSAFSKWHHVFCAMLRLTSWVWPCTPPLCTLTRRLRVHDPAQGSTVVLCMHEYVQ